MTRKTKKKTKSRRRKKAAPQKLMHSVATLRKLESARARLGERSSVGGQASSIGAWIRTNVVGKAAIEQWLDACLDGNSDWSARRMLKDLVEHFDYPFSPKSTRAFAEHLRAIYGERYDLAIEMTAKTRSER